MLDVTSDYRRGKSPSATARSPNAASLAPVEPRQMQSVIALLAQGPQILSLRQSNSSHGNSTKISMNESCGCTPCRRLSAVQLSCSLRGLACMEKEPLAALLGARPLSAIRLFKAQALPFCSQNSLAAPTKPSPKQ